MDNRLYVASDIQKIWQCMIVNDWYKCYYMKMISRVMSRLVWGSNWTRLFSPYPMTKKSGLAMQASMATAVSYLHALIYM